jgi:hypothetical protein
MAHTHTLSLTRVLALQTQGKLLSCSCLQPLFSLLHALRQHSQDARQRTLALLLTRVLALRKTSLFSRVRATTTRTRYIQHANAFANKALCARIRSLDIQVSSSRLVSMSVVTDSACKCSSVTQISNSNPIVSQHIVTRLLAIGKPGLSVMGYGPRYIPMRISFFSPSRTNLHAIVHRPRVLSSTVLRDDFPHLVVQSAF